MPITRSDSGQREVSLLPNPCPHRETLQGPIIDPCQCPSFTLGVRTSICVSDNSPGDSECIATMRDPPHSCHNRKVQGAYDKSNGYKSVIVSLEWGDGHSVPGETQQKVKFKHPWTTRLLNPSAS